MKKKPRRLAFVTWKPIGDVAVSTRLKPGKVYLFLGEIPNMREHCAVVDVATGRVITGYHTTNFTEIPDDEV